VHLPCQSKKDFCAIFPVKNTLCQSGSVAFCFSVLHFALHFAIRRKSLVAKELRQIWPARLVVSPYAVRRYVARQPRKNEKPHKLYICSFVIVVVFQFVDHFHSGIAQCYTYDISKSHTHKIYTVHPCTFIC
jgi:hypothetical protein